MPTARAKASLAELARLFVRLQVGDHALSDVDGEGKRLLAQAQRLASLADQSSEYFGIANGFR